MEFVKDFLIYEAGALCGFFIAALMNAARAGQEITIKFEEDTLSSGQPQNGCPLFLYPKN